MAHYLDRIDVVLVGAEAVVGNGGIINELGTLNVAILAEAYRVPLYVLTETIRFTRFFPLSHADIPLEYRHKPAVRNGGGDLAVALPEVDYTPPERIAMIITDIGCLPPANVSEELLKLYL